jgi:hypothetical protein
MLRHGFGLICSWEANLSDLDLSLVLLPRLRAQFSSSEPKLRGFFLERGEKGVVRQSREKGSWRLSPTSSPGPSTPPQTTNRFSRVRIGIRNGESLTLFSTTYSRHLHNLPLLSLQGSDSLVVESGGLPAAGWRLESTSRSTTGNLNLSLTETERT